MNRRNNIYSYINTVVLMPVLSIFSVIANGQSYKSMVYSGHQLKKIAINEDIPISNLYYQSDDFSNVLKLGDVKETKCEKSPVDEVCVFTFPNMKITYINLNGDFELSEILFFGKQSGIKITDERIFIGKNISQNQQRTSRSFLSSFKNANDLTSKQKFEGGYTYMELFIDENDSIEKIVYKRSLL